MDATGNVRGGNLNTVGQVAATGNVTGANLVTAGRVVATGNITGGNLSGTNITGTLTTAAQTNITSVGTLTSLTVTGNSSGGNLTTAGQVAATGNVTGGNLVTGGRVVATGNAAITGNISGGNIAATGVISATGNITGGNLTTAGQVAATGNITGGNLSGTNIAGTLTTAAQTNITSVGTLTSLTVTGNAAGGNLTTAGQVTATGNVRGGNLVTAGVVSAVGNISGNFFIGNGSQLTGLTTLYGNANVVANLAALGANPISSTANITTTGNISVGNISGSSANVSLVAGLNTWTFDNTGSLTLPANTINIKYANTTAVPFLGVPSWTDAGNIIFSGTGSDPSFPSSGVVVNKLYYRQIGPKTWQVQGKYQTSTASGGSGGVGDYFLRLPLGMSFDTSVATQTIFSGVGTSVVWPYTAIPDSAARYYFGGTAESGWDGGIVVASATTYRVVMGANGGTTYQPWGQTFAAVTLSNLAVVWSFTFQVT